MNGTKVKEIYANKIEKYHSKCQNPCSFFSVMTIKTYTALPWPLKGSRIEITFKENIKVTTSYYLYSGLSLIAEVGGYVGLFLGVSVNQIANLFEWILTKINFF